ncbi:1-acyl-sn-glycerol-3-phosphate acyltransferase [Lentiprolixibacter aurantiacus]|uniref:1-acyl-sn-glycerol-3-phosphate acyltransferase n=1 Tax=Lentiprolixibacter aurantiacus TaxID=2993939 RepID=A0AAE3MLG5_9FLAO|nr:1-acyl-sn-glycerol-3-phosphate acyltransferase [Lentiprolixibacter aurantiacus]MCX2719945.1 1-acyl-sn-glycerol-3-phosphate acyltransferase [Lentiprolixibacter aurantiacus]
MKALASFIYFRLMGWKLTGNFPDVRKCVVIVAPHTSWVDFIVGLLVRKIVGLEINFIGKKSLFRPPFGWWFRSLGGTPVDRFKNEDTVASISRIFNSRDEFRLALSPEGTRKKVEKWRSGFYYIAKAAEVPIVMVAFDFGKKEVKISDPVWPTDDKEMDFKTYLEFYKGVEGKIPEFGI